MEDDAGCGDTRRVEAQRQREQRGTERERVREGARWALERRAHTDPPSRTAARRAAEPFILMHTDLATTARARQPRLAWKPRCVVSDLRAHQRQCRQSPHGLPVRPPARAALQKKGRRGTHAFEGFGVAGGRRGRGRGLGGAKKKAIRCSPKLESNKRPIDLDDNRGATELSGLAFSVFSTH